MKKGNLGIILPFYAVLGFILAVIGSPTQTLLLLGFVAVVEKDEWLTKQVIQAFFAAVIMSIVYAVFGLFDFVSVIPFIGAAILGIINGVESLISLAVLVFAVISAINVSKGKDANFPVASKVANWAYGIIEKKVYTTTTEE